MDKAFYVSRKEFCILAAVSGIEKFYGFELDTGVKWKKEELIETLWQLVSHNWCEILPQKIRLCGEMKSLIEQIGKANKVLYARCGNERRIICYLGDSVTAIEMEADGMLRMSGIEVGEVLTCLQEILPLWEPYWEKKKDAVESAEENELSVFERENLERGDIAAFSERVEIELRDKQSGVCFEKYYFVKGMMSLWLMHIGKGGSIDFIVPDSMEQRQMLAL